VEYENHNMIDYTVRIRHVKGTVIDVTNVLLPKACIAIFNSDHSKLLRTVETDEEGRFIVDRISPGRYWLVVQDQQRAFCPMAARLEVRRWRGKQELAVHMNLSGIDRCSFCEAK
jgi:carboxypeptidase family protein